MKCGVVKECIIKRTVICCTGEQKSPDTDNGSFYKNLNVNSLTQIYQISSTRIQVLFFRTEHKDSVLLTVVFYKILNRIKIDAGRFYRLIFLMIVVCGKSDPYSNGGTDKNGNDASKYFFSFLLFDFCFSVFLFLFISFNLCLAHG